MKKILVVDDDRTNLISAKQALDDFYKVIAVSSGRQAVVFLETNECDLVLLDVEMPMMDGITTLKKIRSIRNGKSIPVIFLTANKQRETVIEGAKLGILDYITKQFTYDDIRGRIENAFAKVG